MTGGLLGLALGTLAGYEVAARLGYPYGPRLDMAVVAFSFSAIVGVGFGFYPARRAARLEPIDALRAE